MCSILGAVLLVGGLYFVLWGKTKEEEREKVRVFQQQGDVEKDCGESKENVYCNELPSDVQNIQFSPCHI